MTRPLRARARMICALSLPVVFAATAAAASADMSASTTVAEPAPLATELPLFDPALRIVPGDQLTEATVLRNTRPTAGVLTLQLVGLSVDSPELARALAISVGTGGEPPSSALPFWRAAENPECTVLKDGIRIEPGESLPVEVGLQVSAALTGQEAMLAHASFGVRAVIRDAAAASSVVEKGTECAGPRAENAPTASDLATTGGEAGLLQIIGAAVLLSGGGLGILLARRRRDRRNDGGGVEGAAND